MAKVIIDTEPSIEVIVRRAQVLHARGMNPKDAAKKAIEEATIVRSYTIESTNSETNTS